MRRILLIIMTFLAMSTAQAQVVQPVITNAKSTADLLALAKKVIAENGPTDDAAEALNNILMMPVDANTMEAQELVGVVQEMAGKIEKAKGEYKFYLTMYPDSPHFKRIQQRLIALEISNPVVPKTRFETSHPHQGSNAKTAASVSSYYYAASNSKSPFSFSNVDSALITNGRVTGAYRVDEISSKVALRYSRTDNLSRPGYSKSVLSTASVEVQDTFRDMGIKVGRQSANAGTLGRFDGAILTAGLGDVKVQALAGVPYAGSVETGRRFMGLAAQYDTRSYSVDAYLNRGLADGRVERMAIGLDGAFSNTRFSGSGTVEYDTLYRALNTVMVQGRATFDSHSPYFLIDYRRAPVLFAEKATVLGLGTAAKTPFTSVGAIFDASGLSSKDIYGYIANSTPVSASVMVGTSANLGAQWTAGTNIQFSKTTGTNVAPLPGLTMPDTYLSTAGTALATTLNLILTGTNVGRKDHTLNIISATTRDSASRMVSLTVASAFRMAAFSGELLALHFSRTQSNFSSTQTLVNGRINYNVSDSVALKSDSVALDTAVSVARLVLTDKSGLSTPARVTTYSKTFYIGIRKDF